MARQRRLQVSPAVLAKDCCILPYIMTSLLGSSVTMTVSTSNSSYRQKVVASLQILGVGRVTCPITRNVIGTEHYKDTQTPLPTLIIFHPPYHSQPHSYLSIVMAKTLSKVIYKPDSQSTDEFIVIVNSEEVCVAHGPVRSTSPNPPLFLSSRSGKKGVSHRI
jgi:hypothetical protein